MELVPIKDLKEVLTKRERTLTLDGHSDKILSWIGLGCEDMDIVYTKRFEVHSLS